MKQNDQNVLLTIRFWSKAITIFHKQMINNLFILYLSCRKIHLLACCKTKKISSWRGDKNIN